MCGILLYHNGLKKATADISLELEGSKENTIENINSKLQNIGNIDPVFLQESQYIVQRGPNYSGFETINNGKTLLLSSVLSLRSPFVKQPIKTKRFVIQYNGELYNDEISIDNNDTKFIGDLLENVNVEDEYVESEILNIIRFLKGEFAYSIIDTKTGNIYFGRDSIGRRSLSYCFLEKTKELIVSSCNGSKIEQTYKEGFVNCLNNIVYVYNQNTNTLRDDLKINPEPYRVMEGVIEGEQEVQGLEKELYQKLKESCFKRLINIHPLEQKETEKINIGLLFSGGLDCSLVLILLCQCILENNLIDKFTINLLNVAFENPRTSMQPDDVPDRKLGTKSHSEIIESFPNLDIKFHKINVSAEDYLKYKPIVLDYMYPKNTEMDLSIAIAFYFASKQNNLSSNEFSKVLFSGLGADEIYGGYHKFNNKSNEELIPELNKQINNIHDRNLNRDDKVIAINGVELRYPFLDENVVEWSTSCVPLNLKRNKTILRNIARNIFNFRDISLEPKRAIQFGSKSAKMFDSKIKGTDKSC
ncbi:related to Asparagine synthetase domain-containing protein YML096W [Hanseniaspora guilliermondii]|uniref:Related to Asparagine synthetase domain-containing protein YML096W n=1 Tax=Hanseniaspora guilliermondii TaxID=56406 RepID=A0A1L0FJ65_9ASCO|nr:related to Asparagine synthetase domain-containing protein YML096W [Hanseniaspora guilliermondii]